MAGKRVANITQTVWLGFDRQRLAELHAAALSRMGLGAVATRLNGAWYVYAESYR